MRPRCGYFCAIVYLAVVVLAACAPVSEEAERPEASEAREEPGVTAQPATPPPSVAVQQALARLQPTTAALRGMHDTAGGEQADGFDAVSALCGRRPDLWSTDFGFSTHPNDTIHGRDQFLHEARRLHREGVLITVSWHQCNPVLDEPCNFLGGVTKPLDTREWDDLLTDGSPLNIRWKAQVDRLAGYLKLLNEDEIPVLLRPYHESNSLSFWWGNADSAYPKALWRQLRTYYVEHHGLTNIAWVWSVAHHPDQWNRVSEYYPGDDVVDVVGLDIYPPTREGRPNFSTAWDVLQRMAPSKPIALSEVSRLPSPLDLTDRPWSYVVPWGENMLYRDNTQTEICSIYAN